MKLLMEDKGQLPYSSEGKQDIGDKLEAMSRIIGNFFMYKLHQEALASGRPRMGVGHHEIIDTEDRTITFVRTFPSSRRFENRVSIEDRRLQDDPDLAKFDEYSWQAAVPRADIEEFIGRDMSELEAAVKLLAEEHERLLAVERKADGEA